MNTIKTKLKFTKSSRTGAWVGFVSINTKNGYFRGVRENSPEPKKVCVVPKDIAPNVEENILYDVEMVPMLKGTGFIVVSMTPCKFKAVISSCIVKNAVYNVTIKFGNKTVIFDPLDGYKDSVKTVSGVVNLLEKRSDIADVEKVIEDFQRTANIILKAFEKDGHYVKNPA